MAHQIAAALYYLHSYGIAHRDIKLENIMMVEGKDDSDLKLVDFGLSKLLGPNETSNEPFGTIVNFSYAYIFFDSPMLHQKSYFRDHMEKM
jgi:serine/threonine protein kinase